MTANLLILWCISSEALKEFLLIGCLLYMLIKVFLEMFSFSDMICSILYRYGFYGDVITESEKYRWMGPKRYDYAGTKVFLRHRYFFMLFLYFLYESLKPKEPVLQDVKSIGVSFCWVKRQKTSIMQGLPVLLDWAGNFVVFFTCFCFQNFEKSYGSGRIWINLQVKWFQQS